MKRTLLQNNRGQVFATAGVTVLVVLAMAGLAADGGIYLEGRRRAQSAADAAAMAGAAEVWRDSAAAFGTINSAAQDSATQNGFTNGANSVTVTINHPPVVSTQYAGNAKFVEAIVTQDVPTTLLAAVGYHTMTPQARAVAGPVNAPICVQALAQSGAGINVTGGAAVTGQDCSVIANSNSSTAISTPNGSITVDSINVVASSDSCNCTPAPQTSSLITPDPLAGLTAPTVGACTNPPLPIVLNGGSATWDPGVYCGGITVTNNASLTLNPGIYIMYHGRFFINAGSTVSGTGVTIYLTSDVAGSCRGTQVLINGTATLSAQTSGSYTGILFFQDKNVGTICPNTIAGGASTILSGALYFPNNNLSFFGGTAGSTCTEIVANTVTFAGPSTLGSNCDGYEDGSLISKVALAE